MSVIHNPKISADENKHHTVRRSMLLLGGMIINSITNSKNIHSKVLSTERRKKKRNSKNIKELYMEKLNDNEIKMVINQILNKYKNPYDICINALIKFQPYSRNKEVINLIKPYLKELYGLMDIVSKEKNEELSSKTINQISTNLIYEKIPKNRFICRYGEKGNHFYIILKGKVVFLVPKMIKCYLNEQEYLTYLIKLKIAREYELLRIVMSINRQYYDLGDDFNYFIRELIEDYKNNNKKKSPFLNQEIYSVLKKIIDDENKIIQDYKNNEENNNIDNNNDNNNEANNNENKAKEKEEIVDVEEYIERTKVNDIELNNKDRKKVNVFIYQITNYYGEGQIFGMVALESKFGKRTSTAITLEDSELGLLTKEQYITSLEAIHHKSLEILFNLISSYSILGMAPKKAFDNRFCHMFKCVRFKRGAKIMEENIKINSVIVFNGGQFTITLNKNILELNDLVIKLHKIRGKMLGLSENVIKKDLSNNDYSINQQFILPETMKMYQKKHNLTISIVNDRLVIGLLDTVDQETHLPLFNCTCISLTCDGYEITNDSLKLVNKEYPCINNTNQIFLINIEYFLKRLYLHIKEIQSKIDDYSKNLKYEIKKNKNKRIQTVSNINNGDKESEKKSKFDENNKNKNEDDENFEIRRNTFKKKKKKNNEKSLSPILGQSLKKEYSSLKNQRFHTIDKMQSNESLINLNNDNKRYENINVMNEEINEDKKENNLSLIYKVKKSIREKEKLLSLAQGKSHKFIEIRKAEIRSLNMARNKKYQKDKYIDISAIFGTNNNSSNDRNKYYGSSLINSAKKKDLILDKIINNINQKAKYERILSSYLSKEKHNNTIKENDEKEKKEDEEKIEINSKLDNIKNEKIIKNERKSNISDNSSNKNSISIEDNQSPILRNKSIIKDIKNENEKDIKYPIIKSNLRKIINENFPKDNSSNHVFESRNIVTLDGLNSLGDQVLFGSKSHRKIFKRYNKVINNNNYKKSNNLKLINKLNNSLGLNGILNDKIIKLENKLPNILSIYNRDKVHLLDPLVFDKFNDQYYNKRLKTIEK